MPIFQIIASVILFKLSQKDFVTVEATAIVFLSKNIFSENIKRFKGKCLYPKSKQKIKFKQKPNMQQFSRTSMALCLRKCHRGAYSEPCLRCSVLQK